LTLRERVFSCERCGLTLSRDHNAAINLRLWAQSQIAAGSAPEAENAR
jgi:transposase